ncbi:MAG TPA: hypothetical protein VK662_15020 [Acidothermaceae bacterium]|nr:hypothetical protein [Acidothermaceae bacterium]
MDSLLLQDWVTIQGAANLGVTQGADFWLDVTDYEDLIFYLDVKSVTTTNIAGFFYETAPELDDASFVAMVSGFVPTLGVQTMAVLATYSACPAARYVRWRIAGNTGGAWNITFRLWIAAYSLR